MSDALTALKEHLVPGRFNFLICLVLFWIAIALLLCGIATPCTAGAIIFFGLVLCCCTGCI